MHTNAECRSQNPSLNQNRSSQNNPSNANAPRPMGRTASAPAPSRGLSAISSLTDSEKARLFDHLQTAHANSVSSATTSPSTALRDETRPDDNQPTVYLSNVYSAVTMSPDETADDDKMVMDTGADQYIFHSKERFINMNPIVPIPIKTADGKCNLRATHRGDAIVKSFDDDGKLKSMVMNDALYCRDISVNLISAIRLCDAGCTFEGNSTNITFTHPNGGQLHARRQSNSTQLWTVIPINQATCLSVSTDIMHQRMGHLHSAALRRFCDSKGKSSGTCTSCVLAKSHRHPF